jgi:HD-GYP domain-containing protein (c-di-GMP phosphodiesterase class II)
MTSPNSVFLCEPTGTPAPSTTTLVERLLFALVNAQLYGATHVRVIEAAADIAKQVRDHCARVKSAALLLGTVAGQVVVDGRPVLGASLFAKRLLQRIEARGAGGVEIKANATADDVAALIDVLARRQATSDLAAANAELAAKRVTAVHFVPAYGEKGEAPAAPREAPVAGDKPLLELHQGTVDLLQGLTIAACQGRELDVGRVAATVEDMVSGLQRDAGYLYGLAQYPEYDFFTFGHSIRVALVALDVARRTTTDVSLLHRIGAAALLHDVGKSLIEWDVLHKRGPLTADERVEMQRHPVLGAGILLAIKESDPLSVAAAYGHHCCGDGKGYPWSCGEHEQSVVTRLVKICDVYEALTAVRPYKPAMSPVKAYKTMLSMRGHFDEMLLGHFMRTIGVHPPGSRVRLDDGSVGRVVQQTDDLRHPVVDIIEDEGGLCVTERRRVDLTMPGIGDPTTITATLAAVDASMTLS